MTIRHEDDIRVTREAADWFMELQSEGSACHVEFVQWLRRSPEHVEEFLAITGISRKLDGIDPLRQIDVEALLQDEGAQVIPLLPTAGQSNPPLRQRPESRWRTHWATGLIAACTMGAALLVWQWAMPGSDTYTTRIGEQRAFKLSDGSLIHLNTQSQAEVRFSEAVREVRLVKGEALFTVVSDAARPFRVSTDTATVQAIGTQFNVYRSSAGSTRVSVVEGAVQVTTEHHTSERGESTPVASPRERLAAAGRAETSEPIRLDAGEQANIRPGVIEKQVLPDVETVTAWRHRQLVFRDKPLAEIVEQFNRYNTVQFDIDPAVGQELLSGVFAADRPESLVLFLEKDRSLRIERRGDVLLIRSRPTEP